jgi:threonylcarbamoyladenosine tRNA methylthiotransferase MtaB
MSEVSAVIGNHDKDKIADIAESLEKNIKTASDILNNQNTVYPQPFFRTRGLIKIQDGCDGECAYCIVPSVRGNPESRNFSEIITHAEKLIESGIPELILTGITIGKYEYENKYLPDLVSALTRLNGNFRIRISSIEPMHVTDALIDFLTHEKVCCHLHIPLQSGSDKILQSMRRPYLYHEFLKIIEKIKKKNQDIAIGTDIIIGYPGETDNDFKASLSAIDEAQFSYAHQFSFSSRSGTSASEMRGKIDAEKIIERNNIMREVSGKAGENYRNNFIGRNLKSIIEKNKRAKGFTAVSSNYIKMRINEKDIDENRIGRIIDICLKSVNGDKNIGVLPDK